MFDFRESVYFIRDQLIPNFLGLFLPSFINYTFFNVAFVFSILHSAYCRSNRLLCCWILVFRFTFKLGLVAGLIRPVTVTPFLSIVCSFGETKIAHLFHHLSHKSSWRSVLSLCLSSFNFRAPIRSTTARFALLFLFFTIRVLTHLNAYSSDNLSLSYLILICNYLHHLAFGRLLFFSQDTPSATLFSTSVTALLLSGKVIAFRFSSPVSFTSSHAHCYLFYISFTARYVAFHAFLQVLFISFYLFYLGFFASLTICFLKVLSQLKFTRNGRKRILLCMVIRMH